MMARVKVVHAGYIGPRGPRGASGVQPGEVPVTEGDILIGGATDALESTPLNSAVANTPAVKRIDPGVSSTLGQVWAHGPGGPAFRVPKALDARDYGCKDDNSTDNAAYLASAVIVAAASGRRTIELPYTDTGVYRVYSTIQVDAAGITFQSTGQWRPGTTGGASVVYYGTGPLFQLDTDNGAAHDANDYSGTAAFFTLRNLHIKHGAPDTALDNGFGSYKAGSYAIRDWRCGEVLLDRVGIENFEYGYWSVAGDINEFSNVKLSYNHVGLYLGPRSDQATLYRLYTLYNDRIAHLDGVHSARFRDCQFVWDGTATAAPITIGSAWGTGANGIVFDDCWFEHYLGVDELPAFVDIGVGDSVTTYDVTFRNPHILTHGYAGSDPHAMALVRVGNADKIVIDGQSGNPENMARLVEFVGSTSPTVKIIASNFPTQNTTTLNSGTGSPSVHKEIWTSAQRQIHGPVTRFTQQSPGTEQITLGQANDAGLMSFRRGDGATGAYMGYPAPTENNEVRLRAGGGGGLLTFYTGSTEKMRLTQVGRLGVGQASPNSLLEVNGSLGVKQTFSTSSLALTDAHASVVFNGSGLTATLPAASGCAGRQYWIKNANASSLTVDVTGGGTIDGAASQSLAQWEGLIVASIGNNWYIVGKVAP